eukprot:2564548-Rhodomonas_salina.5
MFDVYGSKHSLNPRICTRAAGTHVRLAQQQHQQQKHVSPPKDITFTTNDPRRRQCATWEVLAVGMGARSSELRTPCAAISAFNAAQSQRGDGVTPHMSYCRMPWLTGHPGYDS